MSRRSHSAPERVDRTQPVELQPGVLRVRSDGKRVYAADFKAELVRQCLIPGTSVAATAMAVIGLPSGTRVWIAACHTDLRKGFDGLAALVQTALAANPHSGHVFVFRGRRGDIIKVLWSDGQELLMLAKRLENGRFVWPQATSGSVWLTPAQLSMLLEGIDWRMPARTWRPEMVV